MDRCYFIDKETFEVYEEHPKIFSCDPRIAYVVSKLNKLGYHTLASCEGHYEIKEYDVSYPKENMVTGIYILFKEKYEFPTLPVGFNLEDLGDNRVSLEHVIHYFNQNIHKNRREFELEKDKYCKILTEWANNLPEKKGDKYE